MSDAIVRKIIENRLKDNWVLTPIDLENFRFVPKRGISFISVVLSEDDSTKNGFQCTKRIYSLIIEVRVPKNTGSTTMDSYCTLLKELFEGHSEGNFNCFTGHSARVGNSRQWYQKNVTFQCKYKDTNY